MKRLICPGCYEWLVAEYQAKGDQHFYADDGELIYCSNCDYTAAETVFLGATYVEEKKNKLRSQVAAHKEHNDSLAWT